MKKLFIIITLIILSYANLFAYIYTIKGNIVDDKFNLPVKNHIVEFYIVEHDLTLSTTTDENGNYYYQFSFKKGESIRIKTFLKSNCGEGSVTYEKIIRFKDAGGTKINFTICYPNNSPDCEAVFDFQIEQNRKVKYINKTKSIGPSNFWQFGDNKVSHETNPSHMYYKNGTYDVCLTIKTDYCENTNCKKIKVEGLNIVSGKVYAGDNLIPNGTVHIINQNSNKSTGYNFSESIKVNNGEFTTNNVMTGNYLLYVIPDIQINENYFPKYIPTYTGQSYIWNRSVSKEINSHIDNLDINLISYKEIFYGNGNITGHINYSTSKTIQQEPITVILLNDQMVPIDFKLVNNSSGEYTFKNLPFGKYYIHPEKIGVRSSNTEIVISENKNDVNNIDFTVNETEFKIKSEIPSDDNHFFGVIFNTNQKKIYVNYGAELKGKIVYRLFDVTGRLLLTGKNEGNQIIIDAQNINQGIYLFCINSFDNKHITTKKIFIEN